MAGTDGAGHHDGRRAAVAMALVAVALWSSNAVVARFLGDAISPWMMSWLRWLLGGLVCLSGVLRSLEPCSFGRGVCLPCSPGRSGLDGWRVLAGACAD